MGEIIGEMGEGANIQTSLRPIWLNVKKPYIYIYIYIRILTRQTLLGRAFAAFPPHRAQ